MDRLTKSYRIRSLEREREARSDHDHIVINRGGGQILPPQPPLCATLERRGFRAAAGEDGRMLPCANLAAHLAVAPSLRREQQIRPPQFCHVTMRS